MRILNFVLPLLTLCLLAACSSPPIKLTDEERKMVFNDTQKQLRDLRSWEFDGRFAVREDRNSSSASITWLQHQGDYGIKIAGPLNAGSVFLIGNPQGITYKDSDGNQDSSPSPEALLQAHTGYILPVSSLRYWVRGMPDPSMDYSVLLNEQGYPTHLRQQNWEITFQYFRDVGNYVLPRKVIMQNPDLKITLSIHDWAVDKQSINLNNEASPPSEVERAVSNAALPS